MNQTHQEALLKACPFCKGTDVEMNHTAVYWVECNDCGAEGPYSDTEARAFDKWNDACQLFSPTPSDEAVRKALANARNALVTAQTLTTDPDDFKTFHDSILEIAALKEAANGKG